MQEMAARVLPDCVAALSHPQMSLYLYNLRVVLACACILTKLDFYTVVIALV